MATTNSAGELEEIEGIVTLQVRVFTTVPVGTADRERESLLSQLLLDALDAGNLGYHDVVDVEAALYVPEPESN